MPTCHKKKNMKHYMRAPDGRCFVSFHPLRCSVQMSNKHNRDLLYPDDSRACSPLCFATTAVQMATRQSPLHAERGSFHVKQTTPVPNIPKSEPRTRDMFFVLPLPQPPHATRTRSPLFPPHAQRPLPSTPCTLLESEPNRAQVRRAASRGTGRATPWPRQGFRTLCRGCGIHLPLLTGTDPKKTSPVLVTNNRHSVNETGESQKRAFDFGWCTVAR